MPVTSMPAVVPKENVTPVTVVSTFAPGTERSKVAVWLRNGLWGLLPAIEPLALLYVPPGPGGPIIRCDGPVGVPRTSRVNMPPEVPNAQPVETVGPRTNVPSPLTVISWPALEVSVPVVALFSVKEISLRSCATSVGFACRSVRVMEMLPLVISNVAEASTGPPDVVAPEGVSNVMVEALATKQHPKKSPVARVFIKFSFRACNDSKTAAVLLPPVKSLKASCLGLSTQPKKKEIFPDI